MLSLPDNLATLLQKLAAFCAARNISAWLVGGAARDLALGLVPHDLDVAVDANGLELARQFANEINAAFVTLKDERGAGRVVTRPADPATTPRLVLDLVQLQAPTLEEDLRLRDFTINALALPLPVSDQADQSPAFIDPCGGLPDIAAHRLRPCSPMSLPNDPLRILRAVRFGAVLGFAVTPELDQAIRQYARHITQPAAERVRDELLKLLHLPNAAPWLRYLDDTRVLTRIFPELEPARACDQPGVHFLPVLAHTLEAVVALEWLLAGLEPVVGLHPHLTPSLPVAVQTHPDLPRNLAYRERLREHLADPPGSGGSRVALLKLATLLHDNAKPQTKQLKPEGGISFYGHQDIGAEIAQAVAQRLRLSRQAVAYVALVVREHMRPGQLRNTPGVTRRAIARFLRDTGAAGPDLLLHNLADHMATRGPLLDPDDWRHHLAWTDELLDTCWGQPPERSRPLVSGHDLMQHLGIAPGRLVGTLLEEIQTAQAAGEINTPDEALALARQMISEWEAEGPG
ncbi:MAG: CCA tRNA nucleotidyltransferase [Chloroflexaceae bacterium]